MPNLFSLLWGKRRCRALFTTVLVCLDHDRLLVMWTLNDGIGVVLGHAVVGEQGVQEGTKHAPLKGPRVVEQRGRCVVAYPYHLGAVRQEVQDPFSEGGV